MKNEFTVTKKMYQMWGFENMMKMPRLALAILWSCLSVITLYLIITGNNEAYNYIILVYCIYMAFIRNMVFTNAQYQKLAQAYGASEWKRNIVFDEDEIRIKDVRIEVKYHYSDIIKVKVKNRKIWLMAKDKTAIRMFTDTFVNGDWDKCKQMLVEKGSLLES